MRCLTVYSCWLTHQSVNQHKRRGKEKQRSPPVTGAVLNQLHAKHTLKFSRELSNCKKAQASPNSSVGLSMQQAWRHLGPCISTAPCSELTPPHLRAREQEVSVGSPFLLQSPCCSGERLRALTFSCILSSSVRPRERRASSSSDSGVGERCTDRFAGDISQGYLCRLTSNVGSATVCRSSRKCASRLFDVEQQQAAFRAQTISSQE